MQLNQIVKDADKQPFFQPFAAIVNKEGCSVQFPLCSVTFNDSNLNTVMNIGATPSGLYLIGVQPTGFELAGIPITMSEFSITEFFTKLLPLIEAQGIHVFEHEINANLEIPKLNITGKNRENGAKVFIECHVSSENIYQLSVIAAENNPTEREKFFKSFTIIDPKTSFQ